MERKECTFDKKQIVEVTNGDNVSFFREIKYKSFHPEHPFILKTDLRIDFARLGCDNWFLSVVKVNKTPDEDGLFTINFLHPFKDNKDVYFHPELIRSSFSVELYDKMDLNGNIPKLYICMNKSKTLTCSEYRQKVLLGLGFDDNTKMIILRSNTLIYRSEVLIQKYYHRLISFPKITPAFNNGE